MRMARLALADGSVFSGAAFGAEGVTIAAEVVFNTALSGYQESLSDPSYTGQILVQTAPLIGNTGINAVDMESSGIQVSGFVVHELASRHSNYRATLSLHESLLRHGLLGLAGVDTRAITRKLRDHGAVPGVLTDDASLTDAALVAMARQSTGMAGQNLVATVASTEVTGWHEDLGLWAPDRDGTVAEHRPTVGVLDCGIKSNILRHLADRGCDVRVLPFATSGAELVRLVRSGEIHGLFLSNGPGDPAAVRSVIDALELLIADHAGPEHAGAEQPRAPIFGICLGHQLVCLAAGAKTYKLPFGHRGTNQPVLERATGRVLITSQNHGFAVDPDSIAGTDLEVTHVHLNDGTIAGVRLKDRAVFAVQFHPEASPGPHDAAPFFDAFVAAAYRVLSAGNASEAR